MIAKIKETLITSKLFLSIVILFGCSADIGAKDIPIFEQAYEINRIDLAKESAKQINFKVTTSYLSKDIYSFYLKYFRGEEWVLCGDETNWQKHKYLENDEIIQSMRIINYFLNNNADELYLLLIESRISSPDSSGFQSVTLTNYSNINSSDLIAHLSLDCGKDNK